MVNINIIKKFEKGFEDKLKNINSKLDVNFDDKIYGENNIKIVDVENYKNNLDCFKVSNFEENLNDKKIFELKGNSYLKLNGVGIVYLFVKDSLDLFLDFDSCDFSGIFVNIFIEENLDVNIITKDIGDNLYWNMKVIVEKNANLNYYLFNLNSKYAQSFIDLNEKSSCKVFGVNLQKSDCIYSNIKVNHLGDNSNSSVKIDCIAKGNSKIYSDIETYVKSGVKFVEGHQISKGLILNSKSQIVCEPILKIESNEVISSHSASVSNIDNDVKFYLNSRGMDLEKINEFIVNEKINFLCEMIGSKKISQKIMFNKF